MDVTVTVVVVVTVVVSVELTALLRGGRSAGDTTVVVGVPSDAAALFEPEVDAVPGVVAVSAVTAPAPSMSAPHHATADVQPSRNARVIPG